MRCGLATSISQKDQNPSATASSGRICQRSGDYRLAAMPGKALLFHFLADGFGSLNPCDNTPNHVLFDRRVTEEDMGNTLIPLDLNGGGRNSFSLTATCESEIHGLLNCISDSLFLGRIRLGKMVTRRVLHRFLDVLGGIEFRLDISPRQAPYTFNERGYRLAEDQPQ